MIRNYVISVILFFRRYQAKKNRRKYEKLVAYEYERAVILGLHYIKSVVNGDVVEFGTRGVTAAIACEELQAYNDTRTLHLFDVFQGKIEVTEEDLKAPEMGDGKWGLGPFPNLDSGPALAKRLQRTYRSGKVIAYEGLFKNTLSTLPPETKFAMLVFDAVLFSGTNEALNYIFSNQHVSEGAVFLLSSWNVSRASPHLSTRKAWNDAVKKFKIEYSYEGSYNWGGARFIVHSYNGMT